MTTTQHDPGAATMANHTWQDTNPGACCACDEPIRHYDPTLPPIHSQCRALVMDDDGAAGSLDDRPDTAAEVRASLRRLLEAAPALRVGLYGPARYPSGAIIDAGRFVYLIEIAEYDGGAGYACGRYSSDTPEDDRWEATALEFRMVRSFADVQATVLAWIAHDHERAAS